MKKKLFCGVFAFVALQMLMSCGNGAQKGAGNSDAGEAEVVSYLKSDYNSWFELEDQTIESYSLIIAEINTDDGAWYKENLKVSILENKTNRDRAGFFQLGDYQLPIKELKDYIQVLEDISQELKNDVCRYNCNRYYLTSFGVVITYNYSSSGSEAPKWRNVTISVDGDQVFRVAAPYLAQYIQGLKECAQTIDDFVAKKWNNE